MSETIASSKGSEWRGRDGGPPDDRDAESRATFERALAQFRAATEELGRETEARRAER